MLKKLSDNIAEYFVANGADASMKEVYAYGIECTLSTLLVLALQIAAGFILGKPLYMAVFILAWLPLRMLAGGAHANTHAVCTLISVGLGVAAVLLADSIGALPPPATAIISAACCVFYFAFAPVIHRNHPISFRRWKRMRAAARIYSALECAMIILLAYLGSAYTGCVFMGYATTALLSLWGFSNRFRPSENA